MVDFTSLTDQEVKNSGKNRGDYDGFYLNKKEARKYFIKQPADKRELFTELFAGLLLQQFISHDLIDEAYKNSFITADEIKLPDGSYGLSQPKVDFQELFKIIGTGNWSGTDRFSALEIIMGSFYYARLNKEEEHAGLALSLMYSLLLGDYSVHSANVVRLNPPSVETDGHGHFARIDWGAAFRNFGHDDNNTDILQPCEHQGFSLSRLIKRYILFYEGVNGLFEGISSKATELKLRMQKDPKVSFTDLVKNALGQIPADLLDDVTHQQLAEYLGFESFKNLKFKQPDTFEPFVNEFSAVMAERLDMTSKLKKVAVEENTADLMTEMMPFIKSVHDLTRDMDKASELDVQEFKKQYNEFVDFVSKHSETLDLWKREPTCSHNLLVPFSDKNKKELMKGHAFVPQYRERAILRYLYTFGMQEQTGKSRFDAYELPNDGYLKQHPGSLWSRVGTLLNIGGVLVNAAEILKKTELQQVEGIAMAKEQFAFVRDQFLKSYQELSPMLNKIRIDVTTPDYDSEFFYPITDDELKNMNGYQLITICFEELNTSKTSPLLTRIVKQDELWGLMDGVMTTKSEELRLRNDSPDEKMKKLQALRKPYLPRQEADPVSQEEQDNGLPVSAQRIPTSHGLTAGSSDGERALDPAVKPREVVVVSGSEQLSLEEAKKNDSILKQVLDRHQNSLSDAVIKDLRILHEFYTTKKELNLNNRYGESLSKFYQQALEIRLSNQAPQQQIDNMAQAAKNNFHHRHGARRLFADVMMMIGTLFAGLGFVVGLGRKACGKTFFFSTSPTQRQTDFQNLIEHQLPKNGQLLHR